MPIVPRQCEAMVGIPAAPSSRDTVLQRSYRCLATERAILPVDHVRGVWANDIERLVEPFPAAARSVCKEAPANRDCDTCSIGCNTCRFKCCGERRDRSIRIVKRGIREARLPRID